MKHILITLLLILCPLSFSHAQVDLAVGDQGLIIDIDPLYPEPYTNVAVSLNDYSISNQVTEIKWRVDGKAIAESNNQRSISIQTGNVGQKTTVEAVVTFAGGMSQVVRKTVNPTYLDIIVEPQTRTPSFYLGRSLPSIGSKVNLTAIVNNNLSGNDLIYTWRVNNIAIDGGSQRAKNKVTATIPFGNSSIITLDISNLSGETIARRSVQIPSISPSILFYEVNPLYGQSTKPTSKFNLIGDSATIKAEPYNLDILTYNSPEMLEWKINGYSSNRSGGNPYEVTLAREEGQLLNGSSVVDFHVRSLKELQQGGQSSFQVNF